MTNEELEAEVQKLQKRVDNLSEILWNVDQQLRAEHSYLDGYTTRINASIDRIFRNQRLLFEKLLPVFYKAFPDHPKFEMELDKIIGHEIGPEDPLKRSD